MKKYLVLGLGTVFSVALAGTAMAKHTSTAVGNFANGITGSRHNLSSSGSFIHTWNDTGSRENATGTSEMCVFCHTPHFTNRGSGPLWNRTDASGVAVTNYGTTIAGNSDGNGNMFSTLACLTCHDGVTTFDNLVNRPGAGLGAPSGWQFFEGGGSFSNFLPDGENRLRIGTGDTLGAGPGGRDLRDDHPIGVVYRGAGDSGQSASLRARTTVISTINLDVVKEDNSVVKPLVTGNLWAVKGFITDSAKIQDLLRSGTGTGSGNYVQCASCHDLHYKNQTNPDADFVDSYTTATGDQHMNNAIDGLFMRRVGGNSDSGLCRTCHNK